jgi:hypothetical protein
MGKNNAQGGRKKITVELRVDFLVKENIFTRSILSNATT